MIMEIMNIESTVIMRLKRMCEADRDSVSLREFVFWTGSKKQLANNFIGILQSKGLVETLEKQTEEFRLCMEKKHNDKRIKNLKRYCLQKYPIDIIVKVNCDMLLRLWDYYQRNWEKLIPATYPFFVLYMYGG
jgi:hypothetical protein